MGSGYSSPLRQEMAHQVFCCKTSFMLCVSSWKSSWHDRGSFLILHVIGFVSDCDQSISCDTLSKGKLTSCSHKRHLLIKYSLLIVLVYRNNSNQPRESRWSIEVYNYICTCLSIWWTSGKLCFPTRVGSAQVQLRQAFSFHGELLS